SVPGPSDRPSGRFREVYVLTAVTGFDPAAACRESPLPGRPTTIESDILIGIMASATRLDLRFRSGSFRLHAFLPFGMYIHVEGNRRRRDLGVDKRTKF